MGVHSHLRRRRCLVESRRRRKCELSIRDRFGVTVSNNASNMDKLLTSLALADLGYGSPWL